MNSIFENDKLVYLRVVVAGILAAFFAGLIWFITVTVTKYELGIISVLMGFAIGWAVNYGRGKTEVKPAYIIPIISVVLALVCLFVSEYFISTYFVNQYLAATGYQQISAFGEMSKMFNLVYLSLSTNPMTLLFWVISLYGAYKTSAGKNQAAQ